VDPVLVRQLEIDLALDDRALLVQARLVQPARVERDARDVVDRALVGSLELLDLVVDLDGDHAGRRDRHLLDEAEDLDQRGEGTDRLRLERGWAVVDADGHVR
jgi:hypothetical protein